MKRRSTAQMDCSIAKALDVLGDPWTMLVVRDALLGVDRFDDWARRLGIPRATLSARLALLAEQGVLTHDDDRYRLTAKGRALQPVVITLMQWGDSWQRDDPPPTTFVDQATGTGVDPVLVDRRTRRPLDEMRVRAVGPITEDIRTRTR
jgi:DNA-binding HxlR family transcriptional regulator